MNDLKSIQFNDSELATIKESLNLGKIKDSNFAIFIHTCKQYGLDPRLRQISAWEQKDRFIIHMNIDGWLEIANRNPDFDGLESGIIYDGDQWGQQPGGKYHHQAGANFGKPEKIIAAFAVVHRKDRSIPTIKVSLISEYYKSESFAWKAYKSAMIEKVAVGRAIKASFSISNIYTDEEIETIKHQPDEKPVRGDHPKVMKWEQGLYDYILEYHPSANSDVVIKIMEDIKSREKPALYLKSIQGDKFGDRYPILDGWIQGFVNPNPLGGTDAPDDQFYQPEAVKK